MDATFYLIQNYTGLLITEIMYHPPNTTNYDGDAFEFIELKNVASTDLELSGVHFTDGISYTFPIGTFVSPGQFVVLVRNPTAFTNKYPGVRVDGVYTNNLSNSGETVTLVHVTGAPIFSVKYATRPPWPSSADGTGFSLVPANPNLNPDPNNPINWRASTVIGGSPGADDPNSGIGRILINEVLTHTHLPQVDSAELYNPNSTNVYVGNWYLTDKRTVPKKFRIPANDPRAVIRPGGYVVFTDNDWNADPTATNSFRLGSHGEEIYLYSADANGNLTGYSDGFSFGAAQNGVTFGRYIISTGEAQYPAQIINTLGAANAGPRVGPVVINEIRYHPALGDEEFIELKSITNAPVKLYDPISRAALKSRRTACCWSSAVIPMRFAPNMPCRPACRSSGRFQARSRTEARRWRCNVRRARISTPTRGRSSFLTLTWMMCATTTKRRGRRMRTASGHHWSG